MTAELLQAAKANATRQNRTMLVFLIEMALLEIDILDAKTREERHPAGIPQIPRKAA